MWVWVNPGSDVKLACVVGRLWDFTRTPLSSNSPALCSPNSPSPQRGVPLFTKSNSKNSNTSGSLAASVFLLLFLGREEGGGAAGNAKRQTDC